MGGAHFRLEIYKSLQGIVKVIILHKSHSNSKIRISAKIPLRPVSLRLEQASELTGGLSRADC